MSRYLDTKIFGQPLVKKTIMNAIKSHLELKNNQKALALSFHGSSGVGKTFVSQIIAQSLYKEGIKSKFFKVFVATRDFPFNEKINQYKVIFFLTKILLINVMFLGND